MSEDSFRIRHGIRERALTAEEEGLLRAERDHADALNALHDRVESSVKVNVFVPLAALWLAALLVDNVVRA